MVVDKDVIGAFISGVCLLHCLAGPVLIVLGVATIGHAHSEEHTFHLVLLVPILFFAAWSIPRGLRLHHHPVPAILTAIGIGLLVIAFVLTAWGLYASVLGSLLLLSAHLYNRRLLKRMAHFKLKEKCNN